MRRGHPPARLTRPATAPLHSTDHLDRTEKLRSALHGGTPYVIPNVADSQIPRPSGRPPCRIAYAPLAPLTAHQAYAIDCAHAIVMEVQPQRPMARFWTPRLEVNCPRYEKGTRMTSTTRRAVMSTAALSAMVTAAAFATSPARADQHRPRQLTAVQKRQLHRQRLRHGAHDFSEHSPLSDAGINTALDRLVSEAVINQSDRDILGTIASHLFDTEIDNLQTLLQRVRDAIRSTLGDVADTIAAIVQDSVDYAAETLSDVDYETVTVIIAHDMQGAIQGAVVGARAGARIASPVVGAVIGALGGGAGASVIAYYQPQC